MRNRKNLQLYNELAFVCSNVSKLQQEHALLWTSNDMQIETAYQWILDRISNNSFFSG